jgi:hypothetical protein
MDFGGHGQYQDLAVHSYANSGGTFSVLKSNADGTFQSPNPAGVTGGTGWMAAGDVSDDGLDDVVFANKVGDES